MGKYSPNELKGFVVWIFKDKNKLGIRVQRNTKKGSSKSNTVNQLASARIPLSIGFLNSQDWSVVGAVMACK